MKLPTKTIRKLNEVRGEMQDFEVEDRPYRIQRNVPNELKGTVEDIKVPLTDVEILEAGGVRAFFDANDERVDGMWPYDEQEIELPTIKDRKADIVAWANDAGIEVDANLTKNDILKQIAGAVE